VFLLSIFTQDNRGLDMTASTQALNISTVETSITYFYAEGVRETGADKGLIPNLGGLSSLLSPLSSSAQAE
jgi:hypothetical protein